MQGTTPLPSSPHPQPRGGPIGDRRSEAQGLLRPSPLVVTPQGLPLGLRTQGLWARTRSRGQRGRERPHPALAPQGRARGIPASQEARAWRPASAQGVRRCDRGAASAASRVGAQRLGAKGGLRAAGARPGAHEDCPRLGPRLEGPAGAGSLTRELPARAQRPRRQARGALGVTAVTRAPPPRHRAAAPHPLPALAVSAGHGTEVEPPAEAPASEGRRLTPTPAHRADAARPRGEGDQRRGLREGSHEILNSGGQVGACRWQPAQRLSRSVTPWRGVAGRPYGLTHVKRTTPPAAAATALAPAAGAA
jgi:hypothetical protein